MLAKFEASKTNAINDLNVSKKDLEIQRTNNFKLKETIVSNDGQLIFLKEQLQTAMEVTASLGTVKETEEKMSYELQDLRRNYNSLKTDADFMWSELGNLWRQNDDYV